MVMNRWIWIVYKDASDCDGDVSFWKREKWKETTKGELGYGGGQHMYVARRLDKVVKVFVVQCEFVCSAAELQFYKLHTNVGDEA
jgi:hypothetical protein